MKDCDDFVKEDLFVPGVFLGAIIMFICMSFFIKFTFTADGYISRSLPIKVSDKTFICREQVVTYQDIVNDPNQSTTK